MNRDTAIGLLRRTPFTPGGVPEFYAGRSGAALQQLLAPNITWSTDVTWPSRSSGGSAGTGRSDAALHRTGTSSGCVRVRPVGRLVWSHRSRGAGDDPDHCQLGEALRRAGAVAQGTA
jgi:hypothetical protein